MNGSNNLFLNVVATEDGCLEDLEEYNKEVPNYDRSIHEPVEIHSSREADVVENVSEDPSAIYEQLDKGNFLRSYNKNSTFH